MKEKIATILLLCLMMPTLEIGIAAGWYSIDNGETTATTTETYAESLSNPATDQTYTNEMPEPPAIPTFKNPPNNLTVLNKDNYVLLQENLKSARTSKDFQAIQEMTNSSTSFVNAKQLMSNNTIEESNAEAELLEVQPMSQEFIDSDIVTGSYLKTTVGLLKDTGEIDPNWDYYGLEIQLEDIYAKNDFWNGIMIAHVWVFMPTFCEEMSHEPGAGWRWSQSNVGVSFKGISVDILLPQYGVGYESKTADGWLQCHWEVSGISLYVFSLWYVFEDYSEYFVGFRVPQGQKPYAYVAGAAVWYKFWIAAFTMDVQEITDWAYVTAGTSSGSPSDVGYEEPVSYVEAPYADKIEGVIYIESYLDSGFTELYYTTLGGVGEDVYGWHAQNYSIIQLIAIVSNGGAPVANAPVQFWLVAPDDTVYDFGTYLTDDKGYVWVAFAFNPGIAPGGLWWFVPEYGENSDVCGFSYVYCLLWTGYTYDGVNVYLESTYLVPEWSVIQLTANPPTGYRAVYWWFNFYSKAYGSTVNVVMDFDCIAVVKFQRIRRGGGGGGRCLRM